MPHVFAQYGVEWRSLHQDWEIREWRDSGALPTLRNQKIFDRAKQLYPVPKWEWKRFQADLLRLELLEQHGGVYVDTDVEPLAPISPLLDGRSCVVGFSPQHRNGEHPITNCVMAATPGHPYITALIDGIGEAVDAYGHLSLARSVGPWHLTRVWRAGSWPQVTVLPAAQLFEGWLRHRWNSGARRRGEGIH